MKRAALTVLVAAPFLLAGACLLSGDVAGAEDSPTMKLIKAMKAERNRWEKEREEKTSRVQQLEARQADLEKEIDLLRANRHQLYADLKHYRNQKLRIQLYEHENYQGAVIEMDLYARSDKGSEEVYALPNLGKCKCPHSGLDIANWNDVITSVRVQRIQEK